MSVAKRDPPPRPGNPGINQASQQAIDIMIDEIGEQSFPASDPPAWGTLSLRLDQASSGAGAE